jgi:hypothetical protein
MIRLAASPELRFGTNFAVEIVTRICPDHRDHLEEEVMSRNRSNSWKMERASVTAQSKNRPRSNKYSHSDDETKPVPGERSRVWVGGYSRSDGTKVRGHYRANA